jgi:hypothetical protein
MVELAARGGRLQEHIILTAHSFIGVGMILISLGINEVLV